LRFSGFILQQELAVDRQIEVALRCDVIRAFHGFHPVEGEMIAGDINTFTGGHLDVFLFLEAADHGDADDKDGNADVCDVHAKETARLLQCEHSGRTARRACSGHGRRSWSARP
jgi:hypothetical protein